MPVDSQHTDYAAALPQWRRCKDAASGEDAVHAAGTTYLPMLADQSQAEYAAYLLRALFYNATGRTVDGLSGMVFRRAPKFTIPAAIEYVEKDVDTAGTPLLAFCEHAVEELLTSGRIGLLADYPPVQGIRTVAEEQAVGARPYLKLLCAEEVINWKTERINNRQQITLVVIQESYAEQVDQFTWNTEPQMRVLRLVEGVYVVELWRQIKVQGTAEKEWQVFQTFTPMMNGKSMAFIPFLFCGPMGVSECVEKSPIQDLVNVNLSHYRSTADYEHGLHFTGLPTPYVTGHTFDTNEKMALGSTQVRAFANPQAKVDFLEFKGEGLKSLSQRLKEKEEMMAALGARMLGAQKRAAETAETAAIHRSGENGVLASLAIAAAGALSIGLTWCAQWAASAEEALVELNTDYLPAGMTAQDLTALVQALQANAISRETFYDNLQRGEIARQGVDWEEEKADIEAGGPPLGTIGSSGGAGGGGSTGGNAPNPPMVP